MSRFVRCAAVVAGVLICTFAAPADATAPVVNDHYSDEFADDFTDCGLSLHAEGANWGHFMAFEVPGSDGQAFLGHDNYRYRVVLTNTANGEWVLIRGSALFKEMTATHVAGDIWEFTAQEVGQPFVLEDSDGNVLVRDRGRLTYRALFDTLGDGQIGGELLEQEVTGESGSHASFDLDFCALLNDVIG